MPRLSVVESQKTRLWSKSGLWKMAWQTAEGSAVYRLVRKRWKRQVFPTLELPSKMTLASTFVWPCCASPIIEVVDLRWKWKNEKKYVKKKQSITQLAVVLKKKMKMKKWEHSKSMLPHDKPKTISPRPYTRLVQQRTLTETVSQEGKDKTAKMMKNNSKAWYSDIFVFYVQTKLHGSSSYSNKSDTIQSM